MKPPVLYVFIAIVAIGLTTAVVATQKKPSSTSGKLNVAASFYPLAEFASRVGGEHVVVTSITANGVEPHDYEPTPNDLIAVRNSKVFLFNGAGLDPWAERIHQDLEGQGIVVIEATSDVELIEGHHDEAARSQAPLFARMFGIRPAAAHESEDEHEEGDFDPHVWLDPVAVQSIVLAIRDAFISVDPAHQATYERNARDYQDHLRRLDARFSSELDTCKRREFVTSHEAFGYLAHRYDLTQVGISGISPEEEPSAKRLAEISDLVRSKEISYIFFEELVSPKLSETIARETGATTMVLSPLEGLTKEEIAAGDTYLSVMERNLDRLKLALECTT